MWNGDYFFLVRKLILKDFKIRYRNMSLGLLWSLLNPIVMMSVLTFIFTKVFRNPQPNFPVSVLCGLLPFNFFSIAWSSGTNSVIDNVGLVKRVPVPRQVIPISSVLACCLHLLIQMALLLALVFAFGLGANIHWVWLPVVLSLEVIFVLGLSLVTAALNVFVRDTRYVVESLNTVLFWLVPTFYSLTIVPPQYVEIYQLNPLAALAVSLRNILLEGRSPAASLLTKMALVSFASLAVGWFAFDTLKTRFYNYL
jgi:lipopolysaccharide transport system permease protein